ncbi:MAG: rod shape-determining protein MreC [Saprospiraceae bacterium]
MESISLFLIIRFNQGQNEIFLHSSNQIVSDIVRQQARIKQSLDLKTQNDDLLAQNAKLIEELINEKIKATRDSSDIEKKYEVIPSSIINSTIHTLNNYLTLDKGVKDGITKSMGVIGNVGIVGVINQTSVQYSTVISMLNVNLRIAVAIENKDYYGFLTWSGENYLEFKLQGIPKHANIAIGDEIITSGHSSIFPQGLKMGKIESYKLIPGGAFYDILVRYHLDLTKARLVYIIKNNDFSEISTLEKVNED